MEEEARGSGIEVGTVVADTYEVIGQLGRGGMGAVWEAHHRRLPGKKVAIKVLHGDVAADQESLARFKREAEIASRLGHPNIVGVHDFNKLPSGAPYLVLEYLEGESLDARIHRGPIPLDEALSVVRQVGSALRAAHRENVIHRDLKPQNVFLAAAGDQAEVAKVLDFGISKIRGSQTVKTQDSSMLGTPQYMSPEQAVGNHAAVDARTDVFALGAMVYEMLCGQPAFLGETIPEVVFKVVYEEPEPLSVREPTLPPHVPEAVHRALAKKQEDRFPDVDSFIEALTGAPLATAHLRRPPQSGKVRAETAGTDALAATADSGDRPQILDSAETFDSKNLPRSELEATAPTVAGRKAVPAPASSADSVATPRGDPELVESAATQMAASGAAPTPAPAPPEAEAKPAAGATEHIGRPRTPPMKGLLLTLVAAGLGAVVAVGLVSRPWEGDAEDVIASEDADLLPPEDEGKEARRAGSESGESEPAKTEGAGAEKGAEERAEEGAEEREDRSEHGSRRPRPDRTADRAPRRLSGEDPARQKPDEGDLPEEVQSDLEEAAAALRSGHYDRAIRLASRAERKRATAKGYSIKARAYCAKYDLSNARANWRNLPPRARTRVARFCESYDISL